MTAAIVLALLLALVALGSLALLAIVVRISLRRSSVPTVAGDAVAGAIREAANELVTAADGAMYEAKRAGKGRYALH